MRKPKPVDNRVDLFFVFNYLESFLVIYVTTYIYMPILC